MYEWWHNFLYDSDTFSASMFLLFVAIVVIGFAYFMGKDIYK